MTDLGTLYEERREAEEALAAVDDDLADSTVGYAHGGFDATAEERAALFARRNRIEAAIVAIDAAIDAAELAVDEAALERHEREMACIGDEADAAQWAELEEEHARLLKYVQ